MAPCPDGDVTARAPLNLYSSTWSVGRLATVITIRKSLVIFFLFFQKIEIIKKSKKKVILLDVHLAFGRL